ncbi:MAG: sigma-54 dependent transcriptional regulator [Planctomycetes bacterium]|nr:sigma-54 dependent transcriptional regulator [Planctomycetota bacterium]
MAQAAFILILTADEARGKSLHDSLRARHGHSCRVVASLDEALASIRAKAPDVVLTDAQLGGDDPAPPLAELLDALARDATLMTLGDGPAVRTRHIRLNRLAAETDAERLVSSIGRAATQAVARREDRLLKQSIEAHRYEVFEGIVGESPAMQKIVERIKKAARNKLTVLILGETGTGKDLIAEAIHRRSDRATKPMKTVNCAGLNESLLESELFGHVKGSFTGAIVDRKGYFVAADGGSLFLDEIGDMPLTMQAKLLRALERREITPVGSTDVKRVDVRVIAATNADLSSLVADKSFRDDLYYRLNQWVIDVPPVRDRRQDIPLLVHHLLQRANETHSVHVPGCSSEALGYLTKYFWPGNVREMANVIEALAVEVAERQIETDDLPERIRGTRDLVPAAASGMVGLTMAQVERMMIERTLQATKGNREQAAKVLDIGTRTLYRKIKEYGL